MDDIEAERDALMSEKEASCWASSQEEELQSRLTCLRKEKEGILEMLETVKQEEQQLRAELEDKIVSLQTEVGNGVGLQPHGLLSLLTTKIHVYSSVSDTGCSLRPSIFFH